MTEEPLWDKHDVAEYAGISVSGVPNWVKRRGVPVAGYGPPGQGRVSNLYRPADVRRALSEAPGKGNRTPRERRPAGAESAAEHSPGTPGSSGASDAVAAEPGADAVVLHGTGCVFYDSSADEALISVPMDKLPAVLAELAGVWDHPAAAAWLRGHRHDLGAWASQPWRDELLIKAPLSHLSGVAEATTGLRVPYGYVRSLVGLLRWVTGTKEPAVPGGMPEHWREILDYLDGGPGREVQSVSRVNLFALDGQGYRSRLHGTGEATALVALERRGYVRRARATTGMLGRRERYIYATITEAGRAVARGEASDQVAPDPGTEVPAPGEPPAPATPATVGAVLVTPEGQVVNLVLPQEPAGQLDVVADAVGGTPQYAAVAPALAAVTAGDADEGEPLNQVARHIAQAFQRAPDAFRPHLFGPVVFTGPVAGQVLTGLAARGVERITALAVEFMDRVDDYQQATGEAEE